MADSKLSALTADTSPTSDDLVYAVDDPGGTPTSKKVTAANLITKAHGLSDAPLLRVNSGVIGGRTASQARTDLGLAIGTDVQAWDADLDTWAGKTAPSGTVVGTSDTQTLTNKTTTGLKADGFLDTNGNKVIEIDAITAATGANFFIQKAAAAGQAVVFQVDGTDTDVYANFVTKGAGTLRANGVDVATISDTQTLTNKNLTSGTNTFPTFNQNTTGSAATLTTPRAIYGNNFDGSAALTQIIASTYGGTGNGFTKFTGPATAEKTFTLPNSNATLLYDGGALGTPSSATLTNATGLPISGLTSSTSTALGVGSIELGHASDTTIARVSAGVISVEGVTVDTISAANALTNKDLTSGTNTFPTFNQNTTGSAATLTTTRTLWGQNFNGSANVTGSLTSVADITGGASSMTIQSGTGASRTLTFKTTTSGSTATTALTLGADQSATFAGHLVVEGVTSTGATGTGKFVFDGSPTIVTPTIASFTNATHNHSNAAGGGTFAHANLTSLTADDHTQYIEGSGGRSGNQTYQLSSTTGATAKLRTGPDATGYWMLRDNMYIGSLAESAPGVFGAPPSPISMVSAFSGDTMALVGTDILTNSVVMGNKPMSVQTTNATVTTLLTYSTTSEHVYFVKAYVTAHSTASDTSGIYELVAGFRNDSGTLTQISTTAQTTVKEDTAGWDATIDSSGTSIRVRVTGAAATTIRWQGFAQIIDGNG